MRYDERRPSGVVIHVVSAIGRKAASIKAGAEHSNQCKHHRAVQTASCTSRRNTESNSTNSTQNEFMTTSSNCRTPFVIRVINKPRMLLELTNTTEMTVKSVDILTVFLKDESTAAGPSRAHIDAENSGVLSDRLRHTRARRWTNQLGCHASHSSRACRCAG